MSQNKNEKLFDELLAQLSDIGYIHTEDLPNIDLYMDQVTSFMEEHLSTTKRHPDDKVLTKTMINNYTKNHLLPPPENKKYSSEHMLMLIFIYYYKAMLSIDDIQTMMKPLTDRYFESPSGITLTDIYDEIFSLAHSQQEHLLTDLQNYFGIASDTFTEVENEKERESLQQFAFICILAYDIYMRKYMMEKLIDNMKDEASAGTETGSKKNSKKKSDGKDPA